MMLSYRNADIFDRLNKSIPLKFHIVVSNNSKPNLYSIYRFSKTEDESFSLDTSNYNGSEELQYLRRELIKRLEEISTVHEPGHPDIIIEPSVRTWDLPVVVMYVESCIASIPGVSNTKITEAAYRGITGELILP